MRFADAEILFAHLSVKIHSISCRTSQNAVNQPAVSAIGEFYRFIDCGVLGRLEKKQLIKPEPKQISRIMIKTTRAKPTDPEIEQSQVSENAVEKFGSKGAIGFAKVGGPQTFTKNRVGKFFATAPLLESGESDST